MPRLNKIRITGNKYDGFKIRHEDSFFELSTGSRGDHTLFTLQNGSGKGVMLQLIFQIMIPGTSWGKNNGNKLEGMFYDRYNVFKPYTFHVGLEWDLDNPGNRRLLAGICVSARWQKSLNDSEGKVGLKYFLYTHEYRDDSRFTLGKLPLYSKSAGGVIDYDQMEAFIDDNKQDFVKYSKTSVASLNSDYYQYLASHGIYRSEWEIMKTINRSEGGLENYFSRAKDNQALFDKLIIPAVSESISSRSGENDRSLVNMFVDNIKIAENLPELISRTEDINKLQQMVEPLLTDAEHGIKLKKTGRMIRERGNNYLHALQTRRSFLLNELERSKDEQEKAGEKIRELQYQKENLKYARKMRILNELEKEKERCSTQIKKFKNRLKQLLKEEKSLQLNRHYLFYRQYQRLFRHNEERINNLKGEQELSNLREKINNTKEKIKKRWSELKKSWEESSRDISAYQNYLEFEEKSLQQEKENLDENIRQRERILDRYYQDKEKLKQWQNELGARFNPLQLGTPSYLVELLAQDIEKEKNRMNKLETDKANRTKQINDLKEKQSKQEVKLARKEVEYRGLEENYRQRKMEEEEVFLQLIKQLELDRHKEVYNSDWLSEKRYKLKGLLEEKISRLQDLTGKTYELELDLALNDKEYWIANYDQKRLYRRILALDIRVYYGSDFLINFAENKDDLLQQFPLLPYGLVLMYEADWEKIKRNIKDEEIFRSPVPIFINYQLEESGIKHSFKLVHGQESDFVTSPDTFKDWYDGLDRQQKEIGETVTAVKRKVENIRQLIYTAEKLLQKEPAESISAEMSAVKENMELLNKKIDKTGKKIVQVREEKSGLEKKITAGREKIAKLENDYSEIKDFAAETGRLDEQKAEIKKLEERVSELKDSLSENEAGRTRNTKLQFKIEHDRQNWLRDLRRFLTELQKIVPAIEFEEREVEDKLPDYPVLYDYRDSRVNYHYQNLLDLERKEEEKNLEIKYLRKEQNELQNKIINEKEELQTLDPDWQSYSYEQPGEQELEVNLEKVRADIKKQRKKINSIEGEKNILLGEIKSTKGQTGELFEEINERFKKSARSWPDLDLDQKELEINNSIDENRKYRSQLKDMINQYQEKINQLNILLNKLEYYQLDPRKGEINSRLEEQIRTTPVELVERWVSDYQDIRVKLDDLKSKTEDDFYKFKRNINELIANDILKTSIKEKIIEDFRSENYGYNYEMLTSFKEYLNNELNRLDDDKTEAERARNQWAERAAMHVMRIITSLQEMINNMVYHNQQGYAFPLVRMRRSDLLPELEEEIIPELKEYFIEVIQRFKQEDIDVDRLTDSELDKYTGDAALFSRAIRGRYPVLQVYKMTDKNEFKYAKPRDYFYADWESVIQGRGDTPEGSGGQSLSINAFMMMMLLNYKKQRLDKTNPWTLLFLDNPFGKASAAHVLDPVFEIASKLNFQIIAFSAPEIIKTEISERFPVFYPLEISDDEQGQGVVSISGQVIYGERIRKNR